MGIIGWAMRNSWRCLGRDMIGSEVHYSKTTLNAVRRMTCEYVLEGVGGGCADRKRVEVRSIVIAGLHWNRFPPTLPDFGFK